ncbi:hypothetical protein BDK61_1661 [Haloarcula quadrata]|uniref:Uncharacterized protein n=1 Tax=Haloarcula quadrata TaxID=182779 RepID=A0A495R4U6_9EURY|nr:hypothetical protein BDK61_1661 [Haloarcula quadrata]
MSHNHGNPRMNDSRDEPRHSAVPLFTKRNERRSRSNRQSMKAATRHFQVKYVSTPIPIVSSIWSTIIT